MDWTAIQALTFWSLAIGLPIFGIVKHPAPAAEKWGLLGNWCPVILVMSALSAMGGFAMSGQVGLIGGGLGGVLGWTFWALLFVFMRLRKHPSANGADRASR